MATMEVYSREPVGSQPRLSDFERSMIFATRVEQLMSGAKPYIECSGETDPLKIAIHELNMNLIPLCVKRATPDGIVMQTPLPYLHSNTGVIHTPAHLAHERRVCPEPQDAAAFCVAHVMVQRVYHLMDGVDAGAEGTQIDQVKTPLTRHAMRVELEGVALLAEAPDGVVPVTWTWVLHKGMLSPDVRDLDVGDALHVVWARAPHIPGMTSSIPRNIPTQFRKHEGPFRHGPGPGARAHGTSHAYEAASDRAPRKIIGAKRAMQQLLLLQDPDGSSTVTPSASAEKRQWMAMHGFMAHMATQKMGTDEVVEKEDRVHTAHVYMSMGMMQYLPIPAAWVEGWTSEDAHMLMWRRATAHTPSAE